MGYTFKRAAVILCILLAVTILARFMPIWLWYTAVVVICAGIGYLLYQLFF